jgi:hypothetical protein
MMIDIEEVDVMTSTKAVLETALVMDLLYARNIV